jgi:hypothetical protein
LRGAPDPSSFTGRSFVLAQANESYSLEDSPRHIFNVLERFRIGPQSVCRECGEPQGDLGGLLGELIHLVVAACRTAHTAHSLIVPSLHVRRKDIFG